MTILYLRVRVRLMLALILLAVSFSSGTEAQQLRKSPRIGFLATGSASAEAPRVNAFRDGLRQLGYIEAQNIKIEYRYGDGRPDRLSSLATDLVRMNVDVIVAGGTPIRAAKDATTTVPIVMAMSPDPVGSGYVESLARPGRNITGLSSMARELSGKRLELFRDAVPKIRRIGVLWSTNSESAFNETALAAQALNLNIQPFRIHAPDDFEGAFTSMARENRTACSQSHRLFSPRTASAFWTSP